MTALDRYADAQRAHNEALKHFTASVNAAVYALHMSLTVAGLPGLDQRTWTDDFSQAVANMMGDVETRLDRLREAADRETNPVDYL